MKLYLISQTENTDYDTYDSAVVMAENEEQARLISPHTGLVMTEWEWKQKYSDWCSCPDNVSVTYLGEASAEQAKKDNPLILASFNAG